MQLKVFEAIYWAIYNAIYWAKVLHNKVINDIINMSIGGING